MLEYDKNAERLTNGKKKLTNTYTNWAKFLIQECYRSKNLQSFPSLPGNLTLGGLLNHIDESPSLYEEYGKAEAVRLKLYKEDVMAAAERFKKSPDPESREVLAHLNKFYDSIAKDKTAANVSLHISSPFPDNCWDMADKGEVTPDCSADKDRKLF